jgi:hypothetical protein
MNEALQHTYSEDLHMQSLALYTAGFNFQKLHIPPTECIYVSYIDLSTDSNLSPHTPLIGVYNRDEYLLRGQMDL